MRTRTYITLSLTEDIADWLQQAADNECRSPTNYVKKLILEKMKAEQAQTR